MGRKRGLFTSRFVSATLFFLAQSMAASIACADALVLEGAPATTALAKSTTLVIAPPDITEQDYQVIWQGKAVPGLEAKLVPGSLQWVRTEDVLVLARARLHLRIEGKATGLVKHMGASQSFEQEADGAHAEIPVVLLSGERSAIDVSLKRAKTADGAPLEKGTLVLQFHSQLPVDKRVHIDASCSSYRLKVDAAELLPTSWAYVGCRLVYTKNTENLIPSLELYLLWDGIGQTVSINGVPTESSSQSVWPLRLRSSPGNVRFESPGKEPQSLALSYRLRPELHLGSFGVGLGPYTYQYVTGAGTDNVNQMAGVLTFYGSVFFNHYMRSVLFSILPVHAKMFNDTGLYLLIEQARILDNRLSVNFLLGGHSILFPFNGSNYFKFSFPQGIELVFRDLPFRRNNLMFGAFAYPFAGDRAYYNIWLRWGMGPYFGELNYIKWQETVTNTLVGAELWGLSFGMPLFEFL